jgi:uncharacterized membrane protein YphA (DoxX/SURF4 family)
MKYAILIARIVLGLIFIVFGSNAFLHFIPAQPMPGNAGAFIGALVNSGYVYVIGGLQVLGGLCLLVHPRFVALGLTLLGPIIVNILFFHIFMAPAGVGPAILVSFLALFLLWDLSVQVPLHL